MNQDIIQKALGSNIIEDLGLEPLSEEEKLKVIASLTDLIGMRCMVRMHEMLPESDRKSFSSMMEGNNTEEAIHWLDERGIQFEEVLLEEIAKLRAELQKRTVSLS